MAPRTSKKRRQEKANLPRDSEPAAQRDKAAFDENDASETKPGPESGSKLGKEIRPTVAGKRKFKRQQDASEFEALTLNVDSSQNNVIRENTSGLAMLPPELLDEIISYLPQIETPFIKDLAQPLPDNESGLERLAFLRVLSQTCRSLRRFALPLCWEAIQAVSCDKNKANGQMFIWDWRKPVATDLIRQLEIVTVRDPSLAQYVK